MTNFVQTAARDEKGFTLVELAVVMIIVGLLIGGILKGQEMISNAQVTSTIAQAKSFDAAISTFRDQYQGLPGDIAGTRLANCGPVCTQALFPGDNLISSAAGTALQPGAADTTNATEVAKAWAQLAAANLITGVDQSAATTAAPTAGVSIPEASISSSSWQVGSIPNATAATGAVLTDATLTRGGVYLLLDNSGIAAASGTTASLTPAIASRMDEKLDDGAPNTGSVLATGGAAGTATCASAADETAVYNSSLNSNLCGLLVRVQG